MQYKTCYSTVYINLHFYPFLNTSFVVSVQITHNLNGTHLSHMCDMLGVNHTHVGFLRHRSDATSHLHVVYTRAKGKVTRGEYSQALIKWNIHARTELTSTPEQYVLLACKVSLASTSTRKSLIVYLAII